MSISIIDTNNRDLTLGCLRSLFANTRRVSMEVFVVDNACTDGSAEAISAEFPQVQVIRNEEKLGFSTNNNLAMQQAQGRHLLLLNDDTIVHPGAVDLLVEFMDDHPEAGAAGARLLNPDGTNQIAVADFPGLGDFIQPVWRKLRPQRWEAAPPLPVDSVSGACMIVRREAAEGVGLLDTAFDPLYAEEREWCYRIRQAGWQIYHIPGAQITHFGQQTSKRASDRMTQYVYAHRLLFCKKHYGHGKVLLYRVYLSAFTLPKLAWWGGRSLVVASERAVAVRRLRCHGEILRSAWR